MSVLSSGWTGEAVSSTSSSAFVFYAVPLTPSGRSVEVFASQRAMVSVYGQEGFVERVRVPEGWSSVTLTTGKYSLVANPVDASTPTGYDAQVVVLPSTDPDPIYVAIVWHDHQAPNFYPNGTFFSDYAFQHVCSDELSPYYPEGVYAFKAQALLDNPLINVSEEVSPPLLLQWEIATSKGWTYDGDYHSPNGACAEEIRWVMDAFLNLSKEGRDEWLTSFYAHPISGYILSKYGWFDLMKDDLLLGENITDPFTGVHQEGMWLPEMAFTMKDVDLINESGIRFTVLSYGEYLGAQAAPGSSKLTPYAPYVVLDPSTNRTIIAFFRDSSISNYIAFQNDEATAQQAAESAEQVVNMIYNATGGKTGVVTIALDGENWILDSGYPSNSAIFLNDLYGLLQKEQEEGVMYTVTLQQALKKVPPAGVLDYVPTGSWVDMSFAKWTTEAQAIQSPMWEDLNQTHAYYKAAELLGANSSLLKKAEIGLFHASDSDYYWAEYVDPEPVQVWCSYVRGLMSGFLGELGLSAKLVRGGIQINVSNGLNRPVNLSVVVGGDFEVAKGRIPLNYTLTLGPRSRDELFVPGRAAGDVYVWLSAGPYPFQEVTLRVPSYSFLMVYVIVVILIVGLLAAYSLRVRKGREGGKEVDNVSERGKEKGRAIEKEGRKEGRK